MSSYLLGGQMNQAIDECLDQNLSHPTYEDGWTNQATDECLGKKSKCQRPGLLVH